MRRIDWLTGLIFLCGVCLCGYCAAQMPPREELTATPKFVEDAPHHFQSFTEAQLHSGMAVVAARSYAVFGYNTPEVRVKLPHVSNSSYSKIEFSAATLSNAAGKPVKFELEEGGYEESKFSDEIRFRTPDSDAVLQFAHVRGHVKLKYPLEVQTLAFTSGQTGPKELALKIDGPYVSFSEETVHIPEVSFATLRPIRAYDSAGHLLDQYSTTETSSDENGTETTHMAFYGNVARLEIDSVQQWADLDLAYDLTPAPLLPVGHEGENPENPSQ